VFIINRLSKSLPRTLLQNVRFALYSLGDRAYGDQFCAAGRKLGARLLQLGAQPLCEVGYGDDGTPNGGVFYDLDVWLQESLLPAFHKREVVRPSQPVVLHRVAKRESDGEQESLECFDDFFDSQAPQTAYHPTWKGRVVTNKRLTDPMWEQNTRHIVIRVENSSNQVLYQAGDVCSVLPCNSNESVDEILQVLPQSIRDLADTVLNITCNSTGVIPWPKECTLRGWLTYCADIQALPEREDLRELSHYCQDTELREKLLSLSETSASALYADYVLREKRSWRDVLYDFDSIALSLESLFQLLPPIRPRHFSIASASSTDTIELCVAVVEGKTPLGRPYRGLCSSYLASCNVGEELRLWLKPGSFQLPLTILPSTNTYETPILCIGAGTGIAPLRSLVLERESNRPEGSSAECDTRLIFGSRKKTMDFYYQEEWESLEHTKRFRMLTAFSQDQWHKIYVQQLMGENKDMIVDHILKQSGAVYVAGGAKMARSVKDELVEILSEALGDARQAQLFLKRLQKQSKYAVEAWS